MTRTLCLSFSFVLRSGSAAINKRRFTWFVQFAVQFFSPSYIYFCFFHASLPLASSITFARGLASSHEYFTHSLTDWLLKVSRIHWLLSVQTIFTIFNFITLDSCLVFILIHRKSVTINQRDTHRANQSMDVKNFFPPRLIFFFFFFTHSWRGYICQYTWRKIYPSTWHVDFIFVSFFLAQGESIYVHLTVYKLITKWVNHSIQFDWNVYLTVGVILFFL